MKELVIFIIIFLIVFGFAFVVFNGRFIYAQLKYQFLGTSKISFEPRKEFQPQRLVIPAIGVEAPIILPENTDEYILQKALEKGVVLYPNSNIILGHSSAYPWYKGDYGSVFSLLNKLEKGDEIFLFSENKKYTYQVTDKEIKLPEDLNIEKGEGEATLYLISCWPINTDWKRIAVKAVMK